MKERDALLEVERLGRQVLDQLDRTNVLHGECNSDCDNSEECDKITTVKAECPKCGEKFDVDSECSNVFECTASCTADIDLDLPDEEQETLRSLRLALVQLDLARAAERERFDDPMYGVTK